jgi:hypothetical protein
VPAHLLPPSDPMVFFANTSVTAANGWSDDAPGWHLKRSWFSLPPPSQHPNVVKYHGCRVRKGRVTGVYLGRLEGDNLWKHVCAGKAVNKEPCFFGISSEVGDKAKCSFEVLPLQSVLELRRCCWSLAVSCPTPSLVRTCTSLRVMPLAVPCDTRLRLDADRKRDCDACPGTPSRERPSAMLRPGEGRCKPWKSGPVRVPSEAPYCI